MNNPVDINLLRQVITPPVAVRHAELSMIFSADDDHSTPSPFLIDLALQASIRASQISLSDLRTRMHEPPYYVDIWPGEHYKLLAAIVDVLQPQCVIDIGTATGLSALAMKKTLPTNGRIYTFDISSWQSFNHTCLQTTDFEDGKLFQFVENLQSPEIIMKHQEVLENCDMIFIDAAKDGIGEQIFLDNFSLIKFKKKPLFIFDDIKLWNMLKIWREISKPKLDLTSFGHWSGTGLVEWVD